MNRTNRVAARGHQVPPERALPRRAREREPAHVAAGAGTQLARGGPRAHEELPERNARV